MGLEHDADALEVQRARRGDGRGDLGGMVGVVVEHRDAVTFPVRSKRRRTPAKPDSARAASWGSTPDLPEKGEDARRVEGVVASGVLLERARDDDPSGRFTSNDVETPETR